MNRLAVAFSAAALFGPLADCFAADGPEAAELLPAATLLYVEVPEPGALIDLAADHPLRERLEGIDGYRRALQSPQYLQFRLAVGIVEVKLGQGWRPMLKAATAGGIYAAYDPQTNGAVVLLRAEDQETLGRLVQVFVDLAREDAGRKEKPDPIEEDRYRDVPVYKVGDAAFAVRDEWLVVTNKGELGQFVLDRLLDGGGETLAGRPDFVAARDGIGGEPSAWAYADMEGVRQAASKEGSLVTGQTENPAAELLIGGLIDVLRNTPYATAALRLTADRIALTLASPHDEEWIGESREYYFGSGEEKAGPEPLHVGSTLLTLGTYRDVSLMWLRAGDLFNQEMADELAKADSNLSTLFGGRDFGEEILGSIGPELQVVVARQDFSEKRPQPAVKLPAFALVGRLKDPEVMKGELRRTFLSLVGFLNVIGAMNGQPQLDFDLESQGDDQIIATRYVAEEDERDSTTARINFNFSPTIALVGDRVILSSTDLLARELAETVRRNATGADEEARPNSIVELDAPALRDVLADNREQLIAQNMLSEGRDREEAEQAIDALLGIVGLFRDARLELDAADGRIELRLDVSLEP